jgi:ELWxxDGT repeat protein
VTFWADIDPGAGSGSPNDFTFFNNALWFEAERPDINDELFRIAADGSVLLWADINPGVGSGNPHLQSNGIDPGIGVPFAGAFWFEAERAGQGEELWKLGTDGSVTQWTDINPGAGSSDPDEATVFNNALWFRAVRPDVGAELFKLGADGSVTFWADINPARPVRPRTSSPRSPAPCGSKPPGPARAPRCGSSAPTAA